MQKAINELFEGSRTRFATALGVGTSHVSKWCDGGNVPGGRLLAKIGERTGVSVDWLLGADVPQSLADRRPVGDLQLHELNAAFCAALRDRALNRTHNTEEDWAREQYPVEIPAGTKLLSNGLSSAWWHLKHDESQRWGRKLRELAQALDEEVLPVKAHDSTIETVDGRRITVPRPARPGCGLLQRAASKWEITVAAGLDDLLNELEKFGRKLRNAQSTWNELSLFSLDDWIPVMYIGPAGWLKKYLDLPAIGDFDREQRLLTRALVPGGIGFALADHQTTNIWHLPRDPDSLYPVRIEGRTTELVACSQRLPNGLVKRGWRLGSPT